MNWGDFRQRNEEVGARIARRPFVAWAVYTVLFAAFAIAINLPGIDGAELRYALTVPPIIAAVAVGGTVLGQKIGERRRRKP